jgi:anti-sigma factor (TIGR02949 family)
MDCAETIARLWEYLDGEMPPTDSEALRAHLGNCRSYCPCLHDFDRAFLFRVTRACSAAPVAPPVLLERVQVFIARPAPPS